MTVVNLLLVAMLGTINMQASHAKLLPIGNNNSLIDDFLRNFPEATVELNEQVGLNVTSNNIEYIFPADGVLHPTEQNGTFDVLTGRVEIAPKTFIGGSMEFTLTQNNRIVDIGNILGFRNGTIVGGPISSLGANESLAIGAINLRASFSPGPAGYNVDDLRVQFMPADIDLNYNVTASDRAMAGRIKSWLTIKLPGVSHLFQDIINQLRSSGILNSSNTLL